MNIFSNAHSSAHSWRWGRKQGGDSALYALSFSETECQSRPATELNLTEELFKLGWAKQRQASKQISNSSPLARSQNLSRRSLGHNRHGRLSLYFHCDLCIFPSRCLWYRNRCILRLNRVSPKKCKMAGSLHLHLAGKNPNGFLNWTHIPRQFQAFDSLIHFTFEGPFLFLSTFGRQVNTSSGPLAEMCTFWPSQSYLDHESPSISHRERICSGRLPMGCIRSDGRLTRNPNRLRRWAALLLHPRSACKGRPCSPLLAGCVEHGGALRRVRITPVRQACGDGWPSLMQMDDVLSWMAWWESQFEHFECTLLMGLPFRESCLSLHWPG